MFALLNDTLPGLYYKASAWTNLDMPNNQIDQSLKKASTTRYDH
jgi:hypothetical protein